MRTEYYVEFVVRKDDNNFALQSKWFKTSKQALNWLKKSFDYINISKIDLYLMSASFDDLGDIMGDITQEYKINFSDLFLED